MLLDYQKVARDQNHATFLSAHPCSPRRVAVVRQRDVSGAQLVDGPEGGDAAVQPVPALDPDQARDQPPLQGVLDAYKLNCGIKGVHGDIKCWIVSSVRSVSCVA